MAHSSLATILVPANGNNYTKGRPNGKITKITVHHMAGVLSARRCGEIFQNPNRHGSSHYGIGYDGEIASYVEEENTAWTDSNWDSNIHSVTIENSNSANGGDWPVSEATFNSLVKLCADIAKRNGLGKLEAGKNLTWHSMYAATACPGNYLRNKMSEIAEKANAINYPAPTPTPTPTPTPSKFKVGDKVVPTKLVSYDGKPLVQYDEYYTISELDGDRAVLTAPRNGQPVVWAAMNTANLEKYGGDDGFKVGDKVLPKDYVDFTGARLWKTRDFYYISQINGNRAVLRADDPVNGPIYAAVNINNLVHV